MKEKTAMQELIEWIELRFHNYRETEVYNKAIELLEKEKEQIIDAYKDGFEDGCNMTQEFNVLYFEETYKQD